MLTLLICKTKACRIHLLLRIPSFTFTDLCTMPLHINKLNRLNDLLIYGVPSHTLLFYPLYSVSSILHTFIHCLCRMQNVAKIINKYLIIVLISQDVVMVTCTAQCVCLLHKQTSDHGTISPHAHSQTFTNSSCINFKNISVS